MQTVVSLVNGGFPRSHVRPPLLLPPSLAPTSRVLLGRNTFLQNDYPASFFSVPQRVEVLAVLEFEGRLSF